jgi:hypothetical protein
VYWRAKRKSGHPAEYLFHLGIFGPSRTMEKAMTSSVANRGQGDRYIDAPTLSVNVGETNFVYRDIGPRSGVPLILLNHWGAVLDNFDPRIVDGLASKHRVITTNYRGIGASGGTAPVTIDEMARDAIALIRALGFEKVDLLGFSLGGFVAQDITLKAPDWCESSF